MYILHHNQNDGLGRSKTEDEHWRAGGNGMVCLLRAVRAPRRVAVKICLMHLQMIGNINE